MTTEVVGYTPRVIAAAPDLLVALKAMVARYVQFVGSVDALVNDDPVVIRARAAIAKAEGQA